MDQHPKMTLLLGEASTPLVQLQSSPSRQADQERHIHGFLCMLPAIHMVALLLGAFILGALLAIQANVISGGVQQRTPESNPFQFNNLVLRLPPSQEGGGGPKIAWRKHWTHSKIVQYASFKNLTFASFSNYHSHVVSQFWHFIHSRFSFVRQQLEHGNQLRTGSGRVRPAYQSSGYPGYPRSVLVAATGTSSLLGRSDQNTLWRILS